MPLPVPKSTETQEKFISRCIANSVMNREYPNREQRLAVCYSIWKNRNKENK